MAGRDEHFPSEVAALLLRRELVLEVHPRRARLDHRLHQLERVERPAEASLGVRDDRREPVGAVLPLRGLDLVGAQESVVQPTHERRAARHGVEALVGIGVPGEVAVRGDLPAGDVERLEARLHHLHRLGARDRAESRDIGLGAKKTPEPLGAQPGERVLDAKAPAQPFDVLPRVQPLDALPALRCRPTVPLHPDLLAPRSRHLCPVDA